MPRYSEPAYFIAKADQCFRLAQDLRVKYSAFEAADELDVIANEFLARAVEIDTDRDRAQTGRRQ